MMTSASPLSATIPFQRPEWALDGLNAEIVAALVSAASDVALIIDRDGVIRDMAVGSAELSTKGMSEWIGRSWADIVTKDSRHKAQEILSDATKGTAGRWRELNHVADNGGTLPIRYFAVGTGQDGRIVVVGRDLQATAVLQQRLLHVQQSVERDYLRLRQAESRYRLLFQGGSEAVLIVDAGSRRVREANPAASQLLGQPERSLEGKNFASLLNEGSVEAALTALGGASGTVTPAAIPVVLATGEACRLSVSLFRQDRAASLLVRLTSEASARRLDPSDPQARLAAVLEGIPDAFVVTGGDLRVQAVNPAFLDLTHLPSVDEAVGQPLDRFVGRPQIDMKVLMAQLKEHGAVRNFATVLRGRFGDQEEVEVSAVTVPGDPPSHGFTIRSVARRLPMANPDADILPAARSVSQLTQLIGRAPMKEIVRESTDVIERLCIEAALKMTANNRAAAADMLGLSRQSLYSKLNRFGLGNGEPE